MFPNTITRNRQAPLKIEFTPHTARIAENTGYKLTSFATAHSLDFSEPPRRRTDSSAPMQYPTQPSPSGSQQQQQPGVFDAYTRAVAEADSFLNVSSFHESQQHMVPPLPASVEHAALSGPLQTTSTQTTMKSPQPKIQFTGPISHSAPPNEEPLKAAMTTSQAQGEKYEKEEYVPKIKLEKEEPTHYFELLYQPNEKQRKSYKNENRYILPNPLTVVLNKHMKERKVKIDKGSVTVSLLYDTGEELEENREHILDGIKSRALDKEKKAQFHLKVVETSDRNRFRLQFVVRFFVNKVEHVEKIVSHCFRVTSNKKSASIERPRPFAIKPSFGPTTCETEVWIRGKLFTDRANTSVTFGGKEARVIETEDNILVCYAPVREDITEDITVEVKVTNHKGDQSESFDASKLLEFTYIADRKRKRVKKEQEDTISSKEDEPPPKEQATENNMLYCPPSPAAYPQLDEIVKNESELIDRLGYYFPTYFPMEAS